MSSLEPDRELIVASKIFLKEIKVNISKRNNFALETTLSGRSYLKLIKTLQNDGWVVELIYLALPSVDMSKQRVIERVEHGGHNIPLKDIERRFPRSLNNLLNEYGELVNRSMCFMNDSDEPVLIFEQKGKERNIIKNTMKSLLKELELEMNINYEENVSEHSKKVLFSLKTAV